MASIVYVGVEYLASMYLPDRWPLILGALFVFTIVALLGRNGMGKTTTISSIMGLAPPRKGAILLNGKDIAGMPPHKIVRLGVGLIPQGRMIFQSLSVLENLKMVARTGGKSDPWTLNKIFVVPAAGRMVQEQGQSPERR